MSEAVRKPNGRKPSDHWHSSSSLCSVSTMLPLPSGTLSCCPANPEPQTVFSTGRRAVHTLTCCALWGCRLLRSLEEKEVINGADLLRQLLQQLTRVLTGQKSDRQELGDPPGGAPVTLKVVFAVCIFPSVLIVQPV